MNLNIQNERQEEILEYWFGELAEGKAPSEEYRNKWFTKSEETDRYIEKHFEEDLKRAAKGKLEDWEQKPRGALALLILLDQFSRNIYRGTPKAFAQDKQALDICLQGIDNGLDKTLHPAERLFFYMPLMHSEDLEIQKKSVEHFTKLEEEFSSPSSIASMVSNSRVYAEKHYEIIERFGRYPHRNEILGRKSTPEEIEFLKEPGSSF